MRPSFRWPALTALRSSLAKRMVDMQAQAGHAWQQRTRREQTLLRIAGVLALIILPWVLLIRPALDSIQHSQSRLATLRVDASELQTLILEVDSSRSLTRGKIDGEALDQALADSLQRAGLASQVQWQHQAPPQGNQPRRYRLDFQAADAAGLLAWLSDLPRLLSLDVQTLDLRRSKVEGREQPDQLDGHAVLTQPAGGRP